VIFAIVCCSIYSQADFAPLWTIFHIRSISETSFELTDLFRCSYRQHSRSQVLVFLCCPAALSSSWYVRTSYMGMDRSERTTRYRSRCKSRCPAAAISLEAQEEPVRQNVPTSFQKEPNCARASFPEALIMSASCWSVRRRIYYGERGEPSIADKFRPHSPYCTIFRQKGSNLCSLVF
jgi:hypothetical protein